MCKHIFNYDNDKQCHRFLSLLFFFVNTVPPDEHTLPSRVKAHSLLHAARMDGADAVADTNAATVTSNSEFHHAEEALGNARRAETDSGRAGANQGMVKVFLDDAERKTGT